MPLIAEFNLTVSYAETVGYRSIPIFAVGIVAFLYFIIWGCARCCKCDCARPNGDVQSLSFRFLCRPLLLFSSYHSLSIFIQSSHLILYVYAGSWKLVYLIVLLGVTGTSIAFVIYGYTGNTKQTNAFNQLPQDLDAISNWINLVGLASSKHHWTILLLDCSFSHHCIPQ